jgi:poly-gamma-glutamate synthesis protein (capsule biosynthesis protein)
MLHPFALMKDKISAADLTTADLECSFSDTAPVITDDGMVFVSPFAAAAGLSDSGIDAVSVANNHSYNGGSEGFLNTLSYLAEHKIGTFGGGRNSAEAHSPFITTVKGTKVALLAYNSIIGGYTAGADTPGMATIEMAPWGTLTQAGLDRLASDIRAAKAKSDLVFVYFHWSAEYTHTANADMREVAHAAIDAGADLILGSHPHWVQGIEWYKDHLITYSLGNFVFDQEQSAETKQGSLLNATFNGTRLVSATFSPYQIEDYNQPHPANAATAQKILGDIFGHSWWPQ